MSLTKEEYELLVQADLLLYLLQQHVAPASRTSNCISFWLVQYKKVMGGTVVEEVQGRNDKPK